MAVPVFKIIPTTQTYDWGKTGLSSKVAQFAVASKIPGFTLDEDTPYAELWMGTHHSSPARLTTGETLASHLAQHKELIGDKVRERFADAGANEGNLPFLLKVLAIGKALSIQTHPDKKMAESLHAELPNIYKDPNHKPEMALALTHFTALCGFRPLPEIAATLRVVPELAALIPKEILSSFLSLSPTTSASSPEAKAALKDLFSAIMTAPPSLFQPQLANLVDRYACGEVDVEEWPLKELVLTLNGQFPGDIGVFCAFVLNYVRMREGDAIFLAAGEPHAYISGDIVECMATSDNVIRAGLTPKLRDVPNLVAGLTYAAAEPARHLVKPVSSSAHSTLYDPPIPEFAVLRVALGAREEEAHAPVVGPSVVVVTGGRGAVVWGGERLPVGEGEVFFVGADTGVRFVAEESEEGLVLYRAYVTA